jgi:anti-sigma factor RsiW
MTSLVTCKDFLSELSEYLDDSVQGTLRQELETHLKECPNCYVVCDTTKKTIQIYRGSEPVPVPTEVHARLLAALRRKTAAC